MNDVKIVTWATPKYLKRFEDSFVKSFSKHMHPNNILVLRSSEERASWMDALKSRLNLLITMADELAFSPIVWVDIDAVCHKDPQFDLLDSSKFHFYAYPWITNDPSRKEEPEFTGAIMYLPIEKRYRFLCDWLDLIKIIKDPTSEKSLTLTINHMLSINDYRLLDDRYYAYKNYNQNPDKIIEFQDSVDLH